MTVAERVPDVDLESLRASVTGRLVAPGDADYDSLRILALGGFDPRPAAIALAENTQDVVRLVNHARETGIELAVRSGGHSAAGHSTSDGGLVLDLRNMTGLEVEVAGGTAWAQTGLTAAEYSAAVGVHGLATGFGDTGSVGIGGITLGGGIGFLSRKYGMTIDNVLAAELVSADGEVLHLDEGSHPDLLWAIRGGGGNFGVVTRFHYRLAPVKQVLGGMLILPATPETVSRFIELAEAAPDELTTIANVMNCPPMPFVAEEHHGTLVNLALLCYAGDPEAGERVLAPFRALAEPIADQLRPMPYAEMLPADEGDYHPLAVARTMFVERIGRDEAATIVERLGASDAPMRVAQLRVHGGAIARVPPDATAFAHRASRILVNVAAFYERPDDRPLRQAWVDELAGALRQQDTGAYVNFMGDEGEESLRAAYPPATLERLSAIKVRYDPGNLFHRNHNILPAT